MISIITPVYNGEKYIEGCIKNVIEQKCPDIEHIIVDGGSMDRTVEIIRKYAENHPHIHWISEKDKGQSDAMNKGIAMAEGEIIGFLNVDDFYEPEVLNRVREIFWRLPEPSLVVANCKVWDRNGNHYLNKPSKLNYVYLAMGGKYPYNSSSYFYHKSLHKLIGGYKVDEHFVMDVDFILRAVKIAHTKYINETWGNMRFIPGTKTHTDQLIGLSEERYQKILKYYQSQLSMIQKLKGTYLIIYFRFKRVVKRISRITRWI